MTITTLTSQNTYLLLALAIVVLLVLFAFKLLANSQTSSTNKSTFSSKASTETPAFFENIVIRAGFTPDVVLHVAASVGQACEHRLAKAIVS